MRCLTWDPFLALKAPLLMRGIIAGKNMWLFGSFGAVRVNSLHVLNASSNIGEQPGHQHLGRPSVSWY